MSSIPIQNVYYLLCYAWEQMAAGKIAETGTAGQTQLVNLFAQVLINGTQRVVKQGLDRGYVTEAESTPRPRGRIDFTTSLKRGLLPRGKAHCHYDTLSRDVLPNRILKSTLWHLAQTSGIDGDLEARLRSLHRRFGEVASVPLRRSLFQRVQLHSGNAFYRFLLHVCSLVERNLIAEEEGRGQQFRDFLRDEATMWELFEKFVFNFYKNEQNTYEVKHPQLRWEVSGPVPERLPTMQTDVVLQSADRTIIIDTKYSKETLSAYRGGETYESKHLYQLFAYLQNAESRGGSYEDAEGMLLYPTTELHIDDSFEVRGHQLRIRTLDLAQEWTGIHADLLRIVDAE